MKKDYGFNTQFIKKNNICFIGVILNCSDYTIKMQYVSLMHVLKSNVKIMPIKNINKKRTKN